MKFTLIAVFFTVILLVIAQVPEAVASPNTRSVTGTGLVIKVPLHHYSIQSAVDEAKDGDTILISPNTYYENIVIDNKNIILRSDVDGDPTTYDIKPNGTVLNGLASDTVVKLIGTSEAEIDGFTITNGLATKGGGVFLNGGNAVIKNNVITNNAAGSGAGFASNLNAFPVLINNSIINNTALSTGGGLYIELSSAWLWNNLIVGNSALRGGGIDIVDSGGLYKEMHIWYCTFYGNEATQESGGLRKSGINLLTFEIVSSIFWDNYAPVDPQITTNQTLTVKNSDVQGGYTGPNNINVDPLFIDPVNGDFHLTQPPCQTVMSPCVDTAFMDTSYYPPCHLLYFPGGATRSDAVGDNGKGVYREDLQQFTMGEGYDMGFHYPAKYYDSNKWHWRPIPNPNTEPAWFTLWVHDWSADGRHDSGEPVYFHQYPSLTLFYDLTCWMQSAFNVIYHEYPFLLSHHTDYYDNYNISPSDLKNLSKDYLIFGGDRTPRLSPWGEICNGNFDVAFTIDQGGWSEWAFNHFGQDDYIQFDRIQTEVLSPLSWGGRDPIAWCQNKLSRGHPICLQVFNSDSLPLGDSIPASQGIPPAPGLGNRGDWVLSHSITLWEIDEQNETVTITDSDDLSFWFDPNYTGQPNPWGARTVDYDFNAVTKEWQLLNYLSPQGQRLS